MLAGVAFLIVFGGMATLAIWRAESDRDEHAALARRSRAVAALQEARAQFYLSSTLLATAAISENPLPFLASYWEAERQGDESLGEAEATFVADNDPQTVPAVQALDEELEQLRPILDNLIAGALDSGTEAARSQAYEYLPKLWPSAGLILTNIGELARLEQARLTDATAEANNEANTSLWMLVMSSAAGFLIVLAVLAGLIRSLVQPLASLRQSVRRVRSGDMESPAAASGPEEVASLATDFNEMIVQLTGAAEQMRHRLDVESAVARTSALLDSSDDIDVGLNSVLKTLAEAVNAEHAYIFMFKDGNTKMDNTHEWNSAGIVARKERFTNLDCAVFGWWIGKLMRNEEVILHDISQLPAEAAVERTLFEGIGVKCALAVPFGPAGKPDGFMGFGDKRFNHVWQDEDVKLLRLASESVFSFINRQRAEHNLRESEQRFRSLNAAAPIGIFLTDATGASAYVNERLLSISGMSLDEALGLGWLKAIHPEDRDEVFAGNEKANAENREFVKDFRMVTPKGDVRWVSVRSKPTGNLGERVGTLEDITERKQAEDALRQGEERFRTLGASAPIGIFHSDAAGKALFVNERFVGITGVSFSDDEDRNWYDVVHPSDRDDVIRMMIEAIKARGEFVSEFRLLTPEGVTRWVSARAKDMREESGRFIGLMGTIEDITERKQAEDALRQSEERFRSLSASAPVGIFLTDEHDVLTYANECLHDIVGVDQNVRLEEANTGYALSTFVHPDDQQEVAQAHIKASDREPYELLEEFRIVTRQGEERWIRVQVIPILSSDGGRPGRVGTVEDITEHKTLEQERQSAYERTTLLLAMAAEARDPYTEHHLFRIRGYSEAIALQMGLSPDTAKRIGLASLLHDIGKTRVPDAILTKPGPLTTEEWQLMRRHTVWGQELLPTNAWFTTARQIARSHHENWDGSGYPDGLAGEKIPLAAAIVAVADGFDAMTSKRPYKAAWPPARAMRELRQDKSHRYSPEVVEAFERAVTEGAIARIAAVRRSNLSDLVRAA